MGRLKRLVLPGILLLAAYYAVFGGEYSVFELSKARTDVVDEGAELAERLRIIDSLAARSDSLDTDPATLERLARERFGMIKPGETLYRFADEDSTLVADSIRESNR